MAKLKSISTEIWSDTWFEGLDHKDKLLFIYLVTNDKNNMLGVYEISERKIAFETGLDIKSIAKGLKGFERVKRIKYIENHIFLINFLKHQNFNTNMKKSAIDIYNSLPNTLKISGLEFINERDSKGFETLCKGFGMLRKEEVEYEEEKEEEKEDEKEKEIPEKYKIFADTLLKKYFSDIKITNLYKQHKVIRDLNILDGYSSEDITKAVSNAKADNFWSKQLLSLVKLRRKNTDDDKYIEVFLNLKKEVSVNGYITP